MKQILTLSLLLLALSGVTISQEATFSGKLDPQLQPDMVHFYQRVFEPLRADTKYKFAEQLDKDTIMTPGEIHDLTNAGGVVKILLVEPPTGMPFIAYDINGNGTIEANERFVFAASKDAKGMLDTTVNVPVRNPLFKTFPIFIRYWRGFRHSKLSAESRLLQQSVWAFAMGRVSIQGRDVLFQYPFEPTAAAISTTDGLFGIDVDGDGKIRNEQFSPETSSAASSELVFRLGDLYLSTAKIDLQRNEITVRKRSKAEYLRYELNVGAEMPDFNFVDLDGKKRALSEFRGKYVFVDFWGVWCIDCLRETPFQVEAYKRFRARGLEILGLDWDDDIEKVKGYMKKANVTWPQARKDSIKDLVQVTYRIQEFPSSILLSPEGKVLVLDQKQLQGEELLTTLDRILPKK